MGLFGKVKEDREYKKEKKEVKHQIKKLMKSYGKEEIDGATYFNKMMDLTSNRKR